MFSAQAAKTILCHSRLIRADAVILIGAPALDGQRLSVLRQMDKRQLSSQPLPAFVQPIVQYGSDAYITQAFESTLQVMQSSGIPPMVSFIALGLGLRLATVPVHVYAEKLLAKRIHVVNFITQNILKKASAKYNLPIVVDPRTSQIALDTTEPEIKQKIHSILMKQINQHSSQMGLQRSRILNLKVLTSPIWFYSSFAIRNNITGNGSFMPAMEGFLWLPNLCMPDQYWIVPICVGVVGVFNILAQRSIMPIHSRTQNAIDALAIVFSIMAVKIMSTLPVCIPLFWLTVSATGVTQTLLLRYPKMKTLLGISRLPSDSTTPFRDVLLRRKRTIGLTQL